MTSELVAQLRACWRRIDPTETTDDPVGMIQASSLLAEAAMVIEQLSATLAEARAEVDAWRNSCTGADGTIEPCVNHRETSPEAGMRCAPATVAECGGCAEFVRLQRELAQELGVDADTDSVALHDRILVAIHAERAPALGFVLDNPPVRSADFHVAHHHPSLKQERLEEFARSIRPHDRDEDTGDCLAGCWCKGSPPKASGGRQNDSVYPSSPPKATAEPAPSMCPHGFALAENICGPCSEGRPNRPAEKTPAPRGKPCTCDNCLGSSCACRVDAGEKIGELWYCWKRAESPTGRCP